jgi:hypothetical protein
MKQTSILLTGVGLSALIASVGSAVTVDLTTANTSGTVNGALFETSGIRSTGTGVVRSFLRMQANGTEQGYNTSGRPVAFNENTDPNFTRDIQVGDLAVRTINGTNYYEFILDTNEPNGGGQQNVSLDQFQLYTNATGMQTTSTVSNLGTLRYDLDAGGGSVVRVGDLSTGSGQADVRILVPVSALGNASASDFLYLFARFGDTDASGGGFEEFSAVTNAVVIPLPGAAGLAGLGLAGIALRRSRR